MSNERVANLYLEKLSSLSHTHRHTQPHTPIHTHTDTHTHTHTMGPDSSNYNALLLPSHLHLLLRSAGELFRLLSATRSRREGTFIIYEEHRRVSQGSACKAPSTGREEQEKRGVE